MLEHTIDGAQGEEPQKSTEETYYVPKETAEALSGRGKAPSVKRFNRRMLAILSAIGGLVIVLAFAVGLKAPKATAPEPAATTAKPPVPNAAVNALPGDYDAPVAQLGDPRPGDLGAGSGPTGAGDGINSTARQLTPLEQYA